MLIDLVRAMMRGQTVPEFLWDHVVAHAAYIRNRSYVKALRDAMPYEVWFKRKAEITHLQEFGIPV